MGLGVNFTSTSLHRSAQISDQGTDWRETFRRLPKLIAFAALAGILALSAPSHLMAGEGYLSRVGPPALRLTTPPPPPLRPAVNPRSGAAPADPSSASKVNTAPAPSPGSQPEPAAATASATGPTTTTTPPEPLGPPLPPDWAVGAAPRTPPSQPANDPSTPPANPTAEPPTPVVEFRAAGEPVGIKSFDPSGRIGITPQMLVRFFKRRPEAGRNEGAANPAAEADTEFVIPVEFVPPQPLTSPPSSSATYQVVPKP